MEGLDGLRILKLYIFFNFYGTAFNKVKLKISV